MTLSDEQKQAMRNALGAVRSMNDALQALHILDIACGIRQVPQGYWVLDAHALIRKWDYDT